MPLSSAYVEDAADFAKALTWAETRCPGDHGNAMERVERRLGLSSGLLWRLRYRKPKIVDPADFELLGEECGKQRLRVEPRTRIGRWLVEAADKMDRFADAMGRQEDVT